MKRIEDHSWWNEMPKEVRFVHSKCCDAHFEGVLQPNGTMEFRCETCGNLCVEIPGFDKKRLAKSRKKETKKK